MGNERGGRLTGDEVYDSDLQLYEESDGEWFCKIELRVRADGRADALAHMAAVLTRVHAELVVAVARSKGGTPIAVGAGTARLDTDRSSR